MEALDAIGWNVNPGAVSFNVLGVPVLQSPANPQVVPTSTPTLMWEPGFDTESSFVYLFPGLDTTSDVGLRIWVMTS